MSELKFTFNSQLRSVPNSRELLENKIAELREKSDTGTPAELVSVRGELAAYLLINGDLKLAENILEECLLMIEENNLGLKKYVQQKIRLGHTLQHQERFSESNSLFEEVLTLCKNNEELEIYLPFSWQHAGKNQFDQKNFESALLYFNNALELRIKNRAPEDQIISSQIAIQVTGNKINNWNPDFDKYLGSALKFKNKEMTAPPEQKFVFRKSSDIGRNMSFDRVAAHHVTVPSGSRISCPHAESEEEEFVYVLTGEIDLWLNGYIYPLKPGHAVGFPAGTGAAHSFINNSNNDVKLLVSGEMSKTNNLCSFPIDPHLKDSCAIWWDNPPVHTLGPHNGLPGSVKSSELGNGSPKELIFCPEAKFEDNFHYPSDNETFADGFRISDHVGLKALGIWYQVLQSGRRTSFPHAHTHEEELVYVLKGKLKVWMNGFTKELSQGDFVAFPANTGIAHTLINDSEDSVVYLCIGEAAEFPNEKLHYPMNALRSKEGERKGWLWKDTPQSECGKHSGKPVKPFPNHIELSEVCENNAESVVNITRDCLSLLKTFFPEKLESSGQKSLEQVKEYLLDKTKEALIFSYNERPVGFLVLDLKNTKEGVCIIEEFFFDTSVKIKQSNDEILSFLESYIAKALVGSKILVGSSAKYLDFKNWKEAAFGPC